MNSSDQLTQVLMAILGIMFIILIFLIFIFIVIKIKQNRNKDRIANQKNMELNEETKSEIQQNYNIQSIFKFMEFDSVDNNMIVQKNGKRYLMAIQCQGINYDLMSMEEKVSVEEGFLQFLNTLSYQIQIYIQTRTVNLESSIHTYKQRLKSYETQLNKMQLQYQQMIKSNSYSKEELDKYFFEITKQSNLCEYGRDIIYNTEKMNKNNNILNKQYYIIVPYFYDEANNQDLDQEEIKDVAFSELYTKAQSLIRALGVCGVQGRILYSNELIELLYMAYNRDEAEIFQSDKALKGGYEDLYSTSQDVLDKKMIALNKKIEQEAIELANNTILEVKSEKQKRVQEREKNFYDIMAELAQNIIVENQENLGQEVAQESIQKIEKKKEENRKGSEEKNEERQEKPRKRRTKTKADNTTN